MATKITKKKLFETLKSLGEIDKDTRNSTVCSLVGHSKIQNVCFGYYTCSRCGDQLGDSLASVYPGAEDAVIVGHKCEKCIENYKKCTWRDKLYAPDPFKED